MEFEEFKTKVINKSLTVGDAFDHILGKKLSKSKRGEISNVYKGLIGEDVDLNQPYFDVYDKEPFVKSLSVDSKSGKHRFKEFGSFETEFTDALRRAGRNEPYERITDYQKKKGIGTKDFGYQATQIRAKEPMRGVIFSRDFDKIFNEALETDLIDQETKDYMIYEKYTGQRVETNIGDDGLKINELAIARDPNGEMIVQVAEKQVGNKTRPSITYKGAFAEFLAYKKEQALDRAKLLNKKPSEVDVFNTSPNKMDKAWNTYIRPKLEAQFSDSLPLDKATGEGKATPKVIRKILARQLVQEFKYPRDLVKSWMGHAGAGVNAAGDVLEESYVGAITDERTAEISSNLAKSEGRNLQKENVNQLFLDRNPNVVALKSGKAHQTFTAPFTYETRNTITKPERQLTEGEIRLISASAEQQAVKKEIKTEKLLKERDQRKLERTGIAQQIKDLKAPSVEEKPKPKTMQEWSESITEEDKINAKKSGIDLNKLLNSLGKKIPLVAAGIVYAEQKEAGASTGEALGYAGSEFLPISATDADTAGAFVKKAREEGLPEAIGLDTEKQEQMNITRKQRLADRVRQNTSVTPPPEEGFINQNQMGE